VMDWPGLFQRRPLWDIVIIALLAGLAAISITTLLPAFRRLRRHAVHGWRWAFPPEESADRPASDMLPLSNWHKTFKYPRSQ
jgi:hypothetical protein